MFPVIDGRKYWTSNQLRVSGFSLLEIIVAIGIMSMIALGLAVFMKNQGDQEIYLRARQAVLDDADGILSEIRRAWEVRARGAGCNGVVNTATSLSINRPVKDGIGDPLSGGCTVSTSLISWTTVCQTLPGWVPVTPAQSSSLAQIGVEAAAVGGGCPVCPAGQRPVVQISNADTGSVARTIPAMSNATSGANSGGSRSKTLAASVCLSDVTDGKQVRVSFGIIGANGKIQKMQRVHTLSTIDEFSSGPGGVEILR